MERKAFALLSDIERSWWYRGRAATIRRALTRCGVDTVTDILDFGAGYGGMYEELSHFGKNIYAYEPDNEAKEVAQSRGYVRVFSSENEVFARAYNLIGAFDVVEHIEDDRAFLKRAHEALQKGGHLAITVPAFQFLWSIHDVNHHHFRRYAKESMREILREAGFNVAYISYWNMTLFIPAALGRLVGRSGEGALSLPHWIDSIFFSVVKLEVFLMKWFSLPFGTSLIVIARKN